MTCSVRNRRVDGGYGWLVVVSSFFIQLVMDGIVYSYGNLLIEFLDEFSEKRSLTALVGSVLHGMQDMAGPFAAVLCEKFGCRVVAISGAVISCAGFVTSTFATSIFYLYVSYGFIGGAGTFVFNNLTRYLIDYYGWRGCVLLEAGLCIQCLVFALFLLPPIEDSKTEITTCENSTEENSYQNPNFTVDESSRESETNLTEQQAEMEIQHDQVNKTKNCKCMCSPELFKDKRFLTLLISTGVVFLAFPVPTNFIADHAVEAGMSKKEASWLASSIGISNAAGRIIFGWIADRPGVNRKVLFMVLLLLTGASTAVSFTLTTFYPRLVYACLFGTFIGGYFSMLFILLTDIVGIELVSKSVGLLMFTMGIAVSLATPLGGLLYDWTGNYDATFIVAGSEFILGGILVLILKPRDTNTYRITEI